MLNIEKEYKKQQHRVVTLHSFMFDGFGHMTTMDQGSRGASSCSGWSAERVHLALGAPQHPSLCIGLPQTLSGGVLCLFVGPWWGFWGFFCAESSFVLESFLPQRLRWRRKQEARLYERRSPAHEPALELWFMYEGEGGLHLKGRY